MRKGALFLLASALASVLAMVSTAWLSDFGANTMLRFDPKAE